ncbi:ATP-dependent RNA helicase HrpA [Actinobacillus equuli]|nr:ATP-dependent RNA helicase HrpA [Actinobacillus equuli]
MLELIDDCIACAVDKLVDEFGGFVWTEEKFNELHEFVRGNLNDTTAEIALQVEKSSHLPLNSTSE